LTLCQVRAKRGVTAFERMGVLPQFIDVAVHDGWKPDQTCTDAVHALCHVHHLRELAAVTENVPACRPVQRVRVDAGQQPADRQLGGQRSSGYQRITWVRHLRQPFQQTRDLCGCGLGVLAKLVTGKRDQR
jgi:hypothetical protein